MNSAMDSMAANTIGRGNADSSMRDMIGDSTNGAMGTHLTNNQSLSSNAISDYNNNNMTDVQKNMSIIDASRGYGDTPDYGGPSMGSLYDTDSAYDMSPSHSSSPVSMSNSSMDLSGPLQMSPSHSSSPVSMSNSSMDLSGPLQMSPIINMGQSIHGIGRAGSPEERQTMVDVEKAIHVPKAKIVYVDKTLTSKKKNSGEIDTTMDLKNTSSKAGGIKTAATKASDSVKQDAQKELVEELEEDENQPIMPLVAGGTSNTILRPVLAPTSLGTLEKKTNTPKETLDIKLKTFTDEEFITLLEKIKNKIENTDGEEHVLAVCKMNLLKQEAYRRQEAIKNI